MNVLADGEALAAEEDVMTVAELAAMMGPASAAGSGVAPYLDAMHIRSSSMGAMSHGELLVEPISVPSLQHTGIRTTLEKLENEINNAAQHGGGGLEERPLFYPDGRKKKNLRVQVREALRRMDGTSAPTSSSSVALALTLTSLASEAAQAQRSDREVVSRQCRRHDGTQRKLKAKGKGKTTKIKTTPTPGTTRRRPADEEAQALLLSIRQEKLRLDRLCLK